MKVLWNITIIFARINKIKVEKDNKKIYMIALIISKSYCYYYGEVVKKIVLFYIMVADFEYLILLKEFLNLKSNI